MAHVSIIGTGNMGQAIAGVVGRGGNSVELLGQADADKPLTGEIVVLALPHSAVAAVIARRGEGLAGKVVVDITNPVNFETFDSLTVAPDGSASAEIAAALPQSRVLKAFNTTFAATLVAGTVGPLTTTVLIAGDDPEAKSLLAGVVSAGGLKAIDVGSLSRARELEAMGFLQITLAANEKVSWTGGSGSSPDRTDLSVVETRQGPDVISRLDRRRARADQRVTADRLGAAPTATALRGRRRCLGPAGHAAE